MTQLHVRVTAENLAEAEITSASPHSVYIKIEPTDRWDADGLLRLSAMLKGVAATLVTAALLFGLSVAADATGWREWLPGSKVNAAYAGEVQYR